jgi:hypothetical protein
MPMHPSASLVPTSPAVHATAHRGATRARPIGADVLPGPAWASAEGGMLPTAHSPWLCWQTGSLALVSLAAMDGDPLGPPAWRHARAEAAESVLERLAQRAPERGWSVFARLRPRRKGEAWLVLGPQPETTAVIQRDAHSPIALPLTVQLVATGADHCEVRLHDAPTLAHLGLPDELLRRVAALPELIDGLRG